MISLAHKHLNPIDYWFEEKEFREYLRYFYKGEFGIEQRLKNTEWFVLKPLASIDLITFALWKCAKEMPLNEIISSTVPPKLNPMSQIWVYTNIIKDSIVNNEFKKLLAVGTTGIDKQKGRENEMTFQDPIFKKLNTKVLDEIEILIATKYGNSVPFIDGPSMVQLLFQIDN